MQIFYFLWQLIGFLILHFKVDNDLDSYHSRLLKERDHFLVFITKYLLTLSID